MGFNSLLDNQVKNLFTTLGQVDGLAPAHSYVQVTASAYDPATRTVTPSETVFANVPMVLARYKVDEIDSSIIPTTDQKALIAALNLSIVPKEQDKIRLSTGENYNIMSVRGVPGDSIYILQIRRTV